MSYRLDTTALALAAALAAACGGGGSSSSPETDAEATAPAVPGELALKLHHSADLASVLSRYGLTPIEQFGRRPIFLVRAAAGDLETQAAQLRADPRVEYAEPNYLQHAPESIRRRPWAIGGDAGTYAAQWSGEALRLPEAHAVSEGAGTLVAVLDTGVDAAHPALAGRLVPGFDFVDFDDDVREEGAVGDAGFGHGTHVASLLAQVAPGARIMPLRVLDARGEGNIWVLGEALIHAVDPDRDPNTDDGAKVINLSLGTASRTRLLQDLVEIATCRDDDDDDEPNDKRRCEVSGGAVVVAAAGNSGDATRHYPAAEDVSGAIAVAASNEAGALAAFSTRGDWTRVAAPGEAVYGAVPNGGWAIWSGTSMAAPMVAGAAALLRAANPQWKASDVASKLESDGRPLCGSSVKLIDPAKTLSGRSGAAFDCP
jgi:thermitase